MLKTSLWLVHSTFEPYLKKGLFNAILIYVNIHNTVTTGLFRLTHCDKKCSLITRFAIFGKQNMRKRRRKYY